MRKAVRGWRAGGLVGEETVAAAEGEWTRRGPDVGAFWRTLIALFVAVGAAAFVIGFAILNRIDSAAGVAIYFAVLGTGLAVATDLLLERFSFAPTGAEAATSALALFFLGAAAAIAAHEAFPRPLETRLAVGAAACLLAAAAWRWGFRAYAPAAAAAAFFLFAILPQPRGLWLAAGVLAVTGTTLALARREHAPSHRGGLELARAVAVAALYVAVNFASVDHGFVESIAGLRGSRAAVPAGPAARWLSVAATVLFPPALLAWGGRTRHRGLLGLGMLAAAASLATVRLYHHVAPLWAIFAAAGALLAATSVLVERWLRSGPDGERAGFTAAPLYDEGRRERLLPIAAALAAAPAARDLPPQSPGGGGAFGGGGSGGGF